MRKTCGFAQIAQKKLPKTKIPFHAQLSQKIFPVLRKLRKIIAQNRAKLIAFHAQKFAKKICAKIAQILRKRFSHFVETQIQKIL